MPRHNHPLRPVPAASLSLSSHLSITSSDLIWGSMIIRVSRGQLVGMRPSPLGTDLYTLPDTGPETPDPTHIHIAQHTPNQNNAAKYCPLISHLTTSLPKQVYHSFSTFLEKCSIPSLARQWISEWVLSVKNMDKNFTIIHNTPVHQLTSCISENWVFEVLF